LEDLDKDELKGFDTAIVVDELSGELKCDDDILY